ncbi:hypothetical protein GH714_017928 [Hevea brasiliensis]|uniref:Uncharacterized protein n=1 Tax=Hevea brasiliensis TaxID=3981 RepID=A0A6A6LK00_HEVBR|nr:hypothetical protein GH714_017928 [Hevea brasiliensis]
MSIEAQPQRVAAVKMHRGMLARAQSDGYWKTCHLNLEMFLYSLEFFPRLIILVRYLTWELENLCFTSVIHKADGIDFMLEICQTEFHKEVRPGPTPKVVALKAATTLKATLVLDSELQNFHTFHFSYSDGIDFMLEICQIEFHIEVRPGHTPKVVALKAARTLKATWVVLDRQMKKDKKYFMERLQCGISRMKRDNTVEVLRGPKARVNPITPPVPERECRPKFK